METWLKLCAVMYNFFIDKRLVAQSLGDVPEGPKGNADVSQRYNIIKQPLEINYPNQEFFAANAQLERKRELKNEKQKIKYDEYENVVQQLFLYILNNYKPTDILSRSVVSNLMYFCDKTSCKKYRQPITHGEYIKAKYGASLSRLDSVLNKMIDNGTVKRKFHKPADSLRLIFSTSVVSDTSIFSPDRKRIIDQVIAEFSYLDEETIRKFVEKDELFASAEPRKKINILLTNYRKEDIMSLTGG
jgi:hypothetical protein